MAPKKVCLAIAIKVSDLLNLPIDIFYDGQLNYSGMSK
jgi:hypothetical protein